MEDPRDYITINYRGGMVDKQCRNTVYITPDKILDPVRKFFGGSIALDPATESDNPTKAETFFTESDNGLEQEWSDRTFVNPPYGKALKFFTKKIREEAGKGHTIVALLPGQRFETEYWQENILCRELGYCVLIRKRINFRRPSGEVAKGNPYGSMLYLFNTNRSLTQQSEDEHVKECFGELGKIWVARFL